MSTRNRLRESREMLEMTSREISIWRSPLGTQQRALCWTSLEASYPSWNGRKEERWLLETWWSNISDQHISLIQLEFRFLGPFTLIIYKTPVALRPDCCANGLAESNDCDIYLLPKLFWNPILQVLLDFFRSRSYFYVSSPSKFLADSLHMCVNCYSDSFVVAQLQNQVCHFRSDSGEFCYFLEGFWNVLYLVCYF